MKEKLIENIKKADDLIVRNVRLMAFYAPVEGGEKMFDKLAHDTEQLLEIRARFSYVLASQFKIYGM